MELTVSTVCKQACVCLCAWKTVHVCFCMCMYSENVHLLYNLGHYYSSLASSLSVCCLLSWNWFNVKGTGKPSCSTEILVTTKTLQKAMWTSSQIWWQCKMSLCNLFAHFKMHSPWVGTQFSGKVRNTKLRWINANHPLTFWVSLISVFLQYKLFISIWDTKN